MRARPMDRSWTLIFIEIGGVRIEIDRLFGPPGGTYM